MHDTDRQKTDWLEISISTIVYWLTLKLLFVVLSYASLESILLFLPFIITPCIVAFAFVKKNKRACSTTEAFLIMLFALLPSALIFSPVLLVNIDKPELGLFFIGIISLTYIFNSAFLKGITNALAKTK